MAADALETQPVDVTTLPDPQPTPTKAHSFEEDSDTRRKKFQGKTSLSELPYNQTPATIATSPDEVQQLLELADAELVNAKVLR